MPGYIARRAPADIGNADGEQECVQRAVAALLQGGQQVIRALVLKALQRQKLLAGQVIQIGRIAHAAQIVQLPRRLFGQGGDIHRVAPGKMRQPRHSLRAAGLAIDAVQIGPALHQRLAAGRANGGLCNFAARRAILHAAGDFGDYIV